MRIQYSLFVLYSMWIIKRKISEVLRMNRTSGRGEEMKPSSPPIPALVPLCPWVLAFLSRSRIVKYA